MGKAKKIPVVTEVPPPPAPDTPEQKRSRYTQYIQHQLLQLQKELNAWADKFKVNPSYELDWSASVFENAAELKVYEELLADLLSPATPAELIAKYQHETVQRARFPKLSSSVPSNLMTQHLLAAYAQIADKISEWLA